MNITQNFLTKNRCYTNGTKIKVRGLMLHSVGCSQPSAAPFMRNWDTPSVSVCVHGFIQADGEVFQCLPWDYKGWHGGLLGVPLPASVKKWFEVLRDNNDKGGSNGT